MYLKRVAAYIQLVTVYGFTLLIAALAGIIPRRRWKPTGRILVTGTFHNPNWFLSHITPLALSVQKEVIIVTDQPQLPVNNIRVICPPKWATRIFSRIGARIIWMFVAGVRYKPDLYMGYHIIPAACSALFVGKIMGRPACYQMTGGPVEIIGGGIDALESVGGALGRPSKLIESMAWKVARKFDLIVVRGNKAKEFFASKNIEKTVAVITGSVNGCQNSTQNERNIHLVFVGRLSPIKQVHQFIEIVAAVAREIPDVRAAVVGDGPLLEDMKKYTGELGLSNNIDFFGKKKEIGEILTKSKVFVLTSKSEGLSIAMAEAMTSGVVPVVADVGELSELVSDGANGYLIEQNNIDQYAERILSLVQNHDLWNKFSQQAVETARSHCDIEVVTEKWRINLQNVISKASGCCVKEVSN